MTSDDTQPELESIENNIDKAGDTTQNRNANLDTTQNVPRRSKRPNRCFSPGRFTFFTNNIKTENPQKRNDIKTCKTRFKRKT